MRGRPPAIHRPVPLHTTIPEDLYGMMTVHLYSQLEKRVPKGAIQEFLCGLIRQHFEPKPLSITAEQLVRMVEEVNNSGVTSAKDAMEKLLTGIRQLIEKA